MAIITVEIIRGPQTKGEGAIQIDGRGTVKIGDRVLGTPADLQPLIDLGRARLVVPGGVTEDVDG